MICMAHVFEKFEEYSTNEIAAEWLLNVNYKLTWQNNVHAYSIKTHVYVKYEISSTIIMGYWKWY